MNLHTPEPWVVAGYEGPVGKCLAIWPAGLQVGETGAPVCLVAPESQVTIGDEANAHRIVAAVNTCAGVSTESLEAGRIADLVLLFRADAAQLVDLYARPDTSKAITVFSGTHDDAEAFDFSISLDDSGLPVLTDEIRAALRAVLEGK